MVKEIEINGQMVPFKATGASIRLYRQQCGRDLLVDMQKLYKEYKENKSITSELEIMLEDLAYCFLKQADPEGAPPTIDAWLDTLEPFTIIKICPQIIELWQLNNLTTATAKKKQAGNRTGR